ncbi:MAG: amino acid permease, partial [Acidobacteria bacterium]|nr:amino acid permease [Acidobacteriota bacterium]
MDSEETTQPQRLERGLGLMDATTIVVGSMIGSGIFIVSAESSRLVGSPGWLLAAWALAGVLTITGALSCAELAAMMPRAGGQYVFLREAYGEAAGFLFGWSLLLVIQSGTIAAVAVAFANFTGLLAPQVSGGNYLFAPRRLFASYAVSLSTQQLVAVLMILLLTLVNTRGLRVGRWIQNLFTFTKTGALAALVVLGLLVGWNQGGAAFTSSWWDPWANGWTPQGAQGDLGVAGGLALALLVGRAMVGPLFAQSAWNNVTFTAGEVRDPARNLPRALLAGCALVVGLYLLANLAYVVTLPLAAIQNAPQNRVATAAMQAIFGAKGATVMAIAILISTFGCNNGLILAGARVTYAMARDRLFFRSTGTLNERRVPAVALLVQGAWASLLVLPRTVTETTDAATGATVVAYGNVYTQLLEYIISADLVFYALMVAAVIVLRRKMPEAERPYRTLGYPVVPLLYIALAALVVLDLAYLTPRTSGIGYLLVLTGIPVYFLWRRKGGVSDEERRGDAGTRGR